MNLLGESSFLSLVQLPELWGWQRFHFLKPMSDKGEKEVAESPPYSGSPLSLIGTPVSFPPGHPQSDND